MWKNEMNCKYKFMFLLKIITNKDLSIHQKCPADKAQSFYHLYILSIGIMLDTWS